MGDLFDWMRDVPGFYLWHMKHLIFNVEPTCIADIVKLNARCTNAAEPAFWQQVITFAKLATKGGLPIGVFRVRVPIPFDMAKDRRMLGFGLDVAIEVAERWVERLEWQFTKLARLEALMQKFDKAEMDPDERDWGRVIGRVEIKLERAE
jgi:hypothetical protein